MQMYGTISLFQRDSSGSICTVPVFDKLVLSQVSVNSSLMFRINEANLRVATGTRPENDAHGSIAIENQRY